MASSNYPFNQDTAFNSFTITDPTIVTATLGRTYAQSELVPVNYDKVFRKSLTDVTIKWFPLQQYVFVADAEAVATLQSESSNPVQSGWLESAYKDLFDYWKNFLMTNSAPSWAVPLNAPMLVATPLKPELIQDTVGGSFHLILKFDLVVFVKPDSIYA
jgi:hypothetical protein